MSLQKSKLEQFETLVNLYYRNRNIDDYEKIDKSVFGKAYNFIEESLKNDADFILNILQKNIDDKHIPTLDLVVEYIRRNGLLYDQDSELLHALLTIGISIVESEKIFDDYFPSYIISQIYDIVFHQVSFSEELEKNKILYFNLTNQMLDKKFHELYHKEEGFEHAIYFIMMTDGWFETRKEEFLILWEKIQYYLLDYGLNDSFSKDWIKAHEELK